MDDDILVTQIGLLLNQFRYTRRALEDIERNTARYGGVTFAVALAAGPKFGEPPLVGGALKVYVSNISELTISRGGVGLIEGLLGGLGRFIGGLGGGLVGGMIGGVSLWVWVGKLQDIVKGIDRILDRLGIVGDKAGDGAKGDKKKDEARTDWAAALERLTPIVNALTALFDASARGPEAAGKSAAEAMPEEARTWSAQLADSLKASVGALVAATELVKGLTLFVPILIGALAMLLVRLDNIKLAVLDLLQFALRVTLLLRGAALVTIYDTLAAVARLAGDILGILKGAADTILGAIIEMVGAVLSTLEEFLKFAGAGLADAINWLMAWLVGGLGKVLTYLGDLRIFRLVTHLVQVLPAMLPALITLKSGNDVSISDTDRAWLDSARKTSLPGPVGPTGPGAVPVDIKFPDIGEKLLATVKPFKDQLDDARKVLPAQTDKAFDAARGALTGIDAKMQDALARGETGFQGKLEEHLKQVRATADKASAALTPDVKTSGADAEDAGLRAIAQAYETWLKADGLKNVLAELTGFFAQAAAPNPPKGAAAVTGAVLQTARPEAARATVEIGEIVIELEPPKPAKPAKASAGKLLGSWIDGHPFGYDEALERGAA